MIRLWPASVEARVGGRNSGPVMADFQMLKVWERVPIHKWAPEGSVRMAPIYAAQVRLLRVVLTQVQDQSLHTWEGFSAED